MEPCGASPPAAPPAAPKAQLDKRYLECTHRCGSRTCLQKPQAGKKCHRGCCKPWHNEAQVLEEERVGALSGLTAWTCLEIYMIGSYRPE